MTMSTKSTPALVGGGREREQGRTIKARVIVPRFCVKGIVHREGDVVEVTAHEIRDFGHPGLGARRALEAIPESAPEAPPPDGASIASNPDVGASTSSKKPRGRSSKKKD